MVYTTRVVCISVWCGVFVYVVVCISLGWWVY